MTTYTPASKGMQERAGDIIRRYYPILQLVDIKIDILMAATDEEDGEPVKLNGYPCQAVVRILGPKERAKGQGDAEIVIDEANWNDLTTAEQDALLDHEIYHLEVVIGQNHKPKVDPYGRPKLKMRLHDRQFGWFDEIASRHGTASVEVKQATAFKLSASQLYFQFEPPARAETAA